MAGALSRSGWLLLRILDNQLTNATR